MDNTLLPPSQGNFPGPQSPDDPFYRTLPQDVRDRTIWRDGLPQYPSDVTCSMLGEEEPYFPLDTRFWAFLFLFVVTYIIWPGVLMFFFLKRLLQPSSPAPETKNIEKEAEEGIDEESEDGKEGGEDDD